MRKKTGIILFLLAFAVLIGLFAYNNKDAFIPEPEPDYKVLSPVIYQYEPGTYNEITHVDIASEEDKVKLTSYIKQLKQLSKEEMVDLALYNEIVIKYDDNITVYLTLDPFDYCAFDNVKQGLSNRLSKIPDGLRLFVKDKLGIKEY